MQCKPCATAEERRRREQRGVVHAQHAKLAKKCTRCNEEKSVDHFCRNSRSFDGRYSQCRTCVADKVSSWPTKPGACFWRHSEQMIALLFMFQVRLTNITQRLHAASQGNDQSCCEEDMGKLR